MFNRLLATFRNPDSGWDPISLSYAAEYSSFQWAHIDTKLINCIEAQIGTLKGKSVVDLGGGPGQYSVEFALRGAEVTWFDASSAYMSIAREKAEHSGVSDRISFSLGYMDEAPKKLPRQFDFVFNRICWYYGFTDAGFAKAVFRLMQPGGWCYVHVNNSRFHRNQLGASAKFRTWMNDTLALKIGHPYPPHGRVASLFLRYPIRKMLVDYSDETDDRVMFQRS